MSCFMVHVNKCALDSRKRLQFVLKLLRNVMCFPKRSIGVHYDVDLNKVIGSALNGVCISDV